MRRLLLLAALLLLSLTPAQTRAQTQPQAQAAATADPDRLRATARDLLRSNSPEDSARAADLLLKASQIDAANAQALHDNAERRKLENPPAESWKTIAEALTPVLTTLLLAGTLLFNIRDRAQQRAADERKRYVEAVDVIQKSEQVSPTASLISSFTEEPYRSEIRRVGKAALLQSRNFAAFQDLFLTVYDPVNAANFPSVMDLLRSVGTSLSPLLTATWVNGTNDLSRLTPVNVARYNLLLQERIFLGERLATVLRAPRSPLLRPLSLANSSFDTANFSGADLRGAILSNTTWTFVNLQETDLRDVTDFDGFWLYYTAWWQAAAISKSLLDYLLQRFAYKESDTYNSRDKITQDLYEENLKRLRNLNGDIEPANASTTTQS